MTDSAKQFQCQSSQSKIQQPSKGIAHCELAAFSFWVFYDLFVHSIGLALFCILFWKEFFFLSCLTTIWVYRGGIPREGQGEGGCDCLRNIDHKRGSFQKFISYSRACIFFTTGCQGFQGQTTVTLKWFVKRTCQREEVSHNKPAKERRARIGHRRGERHQKQGQQSEKMNFNQKTCFTLLNAA